MAPSQEHRERVTVDVVYLLMALVTPLLAAILLEAVAGWLFGLHSHAWRYAGGGVLAGVGVISVGGVIWLNGELRHSVDD